jgi:diaminopimelate epimerase
MSQVILEVVKMSGAGNTFAVIDARESSIWSKNESKVGLKRPQIAKLICSPTTGIAADGILFIRASKDFDFEWDFYNSDGTSAEMCGNAARCATLFIQHYIGFKSKEEIKILTGAGPITTRIALDNNVTVKMPPCKQLNEHLELNFKDGSRQAFGFVNSGVPHLVFKVADLSIVGSLKGMAQEARNHKDLNPSGANVTFYSEKSANNIAAVTFERGVENFTLACGTGAVAAAFAYRLNEENYKIEVQMPGGLLKVIFNADDNTTFLEGDAIIVGEFRMNIEAKK